MSTLTYPTNRRFQAASIEWWLKDNVLTSRSPLSGSVQTRELPGAQWMCLLTVPAATHADRADVEGFFVGLRRTNRLSMWRLDRPAPRGTLRGSPTVDTAGAAWGSTSVPILGTAGTTLLRGDMLGIGGQLVMVTADVTLSVGAATLTIAPPLRQAVTSGTAVVWDKPPAVFMQAEPFRAVYDPGVGPAVQIQLVEDV